MDRNLILAIVISILIIIGFQLYFQTVSPPPPKKVPAATEKPVDKVKERAAPPAAEREAPRPAPTAVAPAEAVVPGKERAITVDAPKYQAILSSFGGRLVSFKLKDYMQTLNGKDPVNLIPADGPDSSGPSIMFTRRDETLNDATVAYHCDIEQPSVTLAQAGEKKAIVFRATTSGGLKISKTFTFHADKYLVDFSVELVNEAAESRNYLVTFPWKKVYHGEEKDGRFQWNSAEILLNGELKDYYLKDIKGDEEPSGQVWWAGLGDIYFFKALVFGDQPGKKVTLFKPTKEGIAEFWVRYGDVDLAPGKPTNLNLALYLGPKESTALAAAGHNLSKALIYSYNWVLEMMSVYLMKFLKLCNNGFEVFGIKVPGTHNWGWDIIILTVVIKILFIPLTHKSTQSMKRMQDLQPQIAKLKEKYKDDKAALNKATMELFREHKVNPLGSCWPMFLQLPVFIALYQSLSYAIELRHAGFVCIPSIYLCIADLSAPDPYYVTPILMGGTMVLQQWMTPSAGDPMQRKMMLLMPVIFTWMFLSFPSGLVLYWLISNVLSIAQQAITNMMAK
ncbi:MAG: membrane protein insertase YidC [Desulfomonile sp.]|nr:membrane protein insertase YidC [Desulfomonile sp.]